MDRMWIVQAEVVWITPDGYRRSCGVPTFFLHTDVQGITDEAHAEQIAKRIIDPFGLLETVSVSVCKAEED